MICIKNLTFSINEKIICNNLNIELDTHSRLAIIGRNGVGKSSLIKNIINPIPNTVFIQENHITKNKIDLSSISDKHKMHYISYSSQLSQYSNNINIENLYSLVPNKIEWEHIQKYLDIFQIPLQQISNLSGGEAQLAYITTCLIQNSKLILLDEPTTYLDWINADKLLQLLVERSVAYKCVVIAVIHDLYKIDKYFTHILYLKGLGEWEFCETNNFDYRKLYN